MHAVDVMMATLKSLQKLNADENSRLLNSANEIVSPMFAESVLATI